jgi:hypothetical protein
MDPNRNPPLHLTPLGCDPVRLYDDEDVDAALRRDLAVSRDAVANGIDYVAIESELLALVAGDPTRDACG